MDFNEKDVRKTYQFLNHSAHGITELRVIRFLTGGKTSVGECAYVETEDEFVSFCRRNNAKGNVFTGINPIKAEKKTGKYRPSKKGDVDIVQSMVIDIDPKRKPGTASTDNEMLLSKNIGERIADDLEDEGFVRPAVNLSGNGCQLWFSIPPVSLTDENRYNFEKQIKAFEEEIADSNDDVAIQIDSMATYNHLIKVMGTLSVKGKSTFERPHRLSVFDQDADKKEDAKLLEHLLSFEVKEKAIHAKNATLHLEKIQNMPDAEISLLVLKATSKMCDGVKKLWDKGYPGDRSVAIFNMVMILAFEKFSLEEIILLVIYFDQNTNMHKLAGRDAPDYIQKAYNKVMDESDSNPTPPHLWLKDKGYCKDEIPCHVQKILKLNEIKDWHKAVKDLVLDKGDIDSAYRKIEPIIRYAAKNTKEQNAVLDSLKKAFPAFNKNILKKMIKEIHKEINQAFKDDSIGYTGVYIEDNCYKQVVYDGEGTKVMELSNFHMKIKKDIIFSSDIAEDRILEGDFITKKGKTYPFRFSSEEFSNNNKLAHQIMKQAGPDLQYNGNLTHLKLATQAVSKAKTIHMSDNFGWDDDYKTYRTPTVHINKEGIYTSSKTYIDMTNHDHAKYLNMQRLDKESLKNVIQHILDDFMTLSDARVITPVIGHIFLAPIQELMGDDKYALWVLGLTGVGKSFLAKLSQCFFGDFRRSGSVVSWNSTVNSIQTIGFLFKDAIYVVDDYKRNNKNEDDIIEKIQSYADKTGKSRLRPDASVQKTRYIRGLLFVTGEDTPTNEASTISRLMIIHYPKAPTDQVVGARCMKYSDQYSGVMAAYIHWFLKNEISEELEEMFQKYITEVYEKIKGKQNGIRIAQNLAQNKIGFTLFTRFLEDEGYIPKRDKNVLDLTHDENLLSLTGEMTQAVKEQQASKVFMQMLNELIVSGKIYIDVELDNSSVSPLYRDLHERMNKYYEQQAENRYVVGFMESENADTVYLLPLITWREVQKAIRESGDSFRFGKKAVLSQLQEDGYIVESEIPPDRIHSSTTRKYYRGKQIRVWAIAAEKMDLPGGEDK